MNNRPYIQDAVTDFSYGVCLFYLTAAGAFAGKGADGIVLDLLAFKDTGAARLKRLPGHGPALTVHDLARNILPAKIAHAIHRVTHLRRIKPAGRINTMAVEQTAIGFLRAYRLIL